MSVHGEYSRALEGLIACLRALDLADRSEWLERFEAARVDRHPDLSAAARSARGALEKLAAANAATGASGTASWGPRVADAHAHLRAHVRIILGERE